MDDEANPKGLAIPFLTSYTELIEKKTDPLTAGEKSGLVEAYNNLGAFYIKTDQAKAKEYFNKTLALEPTNEYATSVIKTLASN